MSDPTNTVLVGPLDGGWRWFCGCGARYWYRNEREARDAGLVHQKGCQMREVQP